MLVEADAVPRRLRGGAGSSLMASDIHAEAGTRGVEVYVLGFPQGADPWEAADQLATLLGPELAQTVPVQLPQGRGWLADRLAARDPAVIRHPRIGVLGACGGIGTSTMTLWLAARLIEEGHPAAVMDLAPGSAGLDAWASPDPLPGLRWQEIAEMPALPDPGRLAAGLPAPHGVPILSSSLREELPGNGREAAVVRCLTTQVLQVMDLGRIGDPVPWRRASQEAGPVPLPRSALLGLCTAAVLLVPFSVRGICQARQWMQAHRRLLPVLPVGVGPRWCDLSSAELGEALGTPLTGVIPPRHKVPVAAEEGRLLEEACHRSLRRPVAQVAEALARSLPGTAVGHSPQPLRSPGGLRGGRQASSSRTGRAAAAQFVEAIPTQSFGERAS